MSIARIRKGDTVVVISGNDAGKTGKVKTLDAKAGKAVVEGLNVHKKAIRKREGVEGGLVPVEQPIRLCKLMPYDPDAKKGVRVGTTTKDDKKARQSKATGKII